MAGRRQASQTDMLPVRIHKGNEENLGRDMWTLNKIKDTKLGKKRILRGWMSNFFVEVL